MSRTRVRHRCGACGTTAPQWLGRCPECGEWGSLVEEVERVVAGGSRGRPSEETVPRPLADVDPLGATRLPTGVAEVDRVLGGGFVPGSVTLVGGEPGIGKSTVALQVLGAMCASGARGLLVSAEESPAQVRLRAGRLGTIDPGLLVVAETSLPNIVAAAEAVRPDLLVVDSIQTVHDPDSTGGPGSVAQVRDGAAALVRFAKERGVATMLIGHVTKEGTLAGPRVLEHLVDTVLYFEGDRHHALRMLRATKHRFGPTDELGLFEMTAGGLRGVPDASAFFLSDRRPGTPGSVITAVVDGTRPLLVEVQALTSRVNSPHARRSTQGLDGARLEMLLAVLTQRAGIPFNEQDVYASVTGGIRIAETGADLALALALAGARMGTPVPGDMIVLGEVGLGGEVRQVMHAPRRLAEAARLGFSRAVAPASTPEVAGMSIRRVRSIDEALSAVGLTDLDADALLHEQFHSVAGSLAASG